MKKLLRAGEMIPSECLNNYLVRLERLNREAKGDDMMNKSLNKLL